MRYSPRKECISFAFYCFENPSIAVTLEPYHWSDSGGVFRTSPNEHFNQIENQLKMSHVRLQTDFP